MVYAKTKPAAARLSEAIWQNLPAKEYLAAVYGRPEPSRGILEDLLWKDVRKNKTFVVHRMRKGVWPAVLDYQVVESKADRSLVHIRLHTGRSHQIRVQFASRKWPLVGDGKYGARDNQALALFSCKLAFPHPITKQAMEFESLPDTLGGFSLKKTDP